VTSGEAFVLSPLQAHALTRQPASAGVEAEVVVRGAVDESAVHAALASIVDRHEILRTRVERGPDGAFAQMIDSADSLTAPETIDLRGGSPAEQSTRAVEWFSSRSRPTAVRWCVARRPDDDLSVMMQFAPCSADAATVALVAEELTALLSGGEAPLTELDVQYADVAPWLEDVLSAPEGVDARRDATIAADVEAAMPSLPFVRDGDSSAPFERRSAEAAICARAQERLGREPDGAVFLLTCWLAFLARATGARDVVVGVTLDGRRREELRRMLGPLTRRVRLRAEVELARTVDALASSVGPARERALLHQEHVAPPRTRCRYVFTEGHGEGMFTAGGVSVEIERVRAPADPFLLALEAPGGGVGHVRLAYDAAAVDDAVAQSLLDQLVRFLSDAAARPDASIRSLRRSSEQHRRRAREWAYASADYGDPIAVHELIAAQVERTPGAPAASDRICELTYAELWARAAAVAARIEKLGAGPGVAVAASVGRTVDAVSTLLGIMRAGAAYVPLDSLSPPARLATILADVGATVLVTDGTFEGERSRLELVDVSGLETAEPAGSAATPDALAYVVYTSGSTGTPKGVCVSHRSLFNRLAWSQATYPLRKSDRVLCGAGLAFDFSIWEMLAPLLAGATCVVASEDVYHDPAALATWLADERISVAHFTPHLFREVLEAADFQRAAALRLVLSGGDALSRQVSDRFRELSDAMLFNQYGPTEGTIDATFWLVDDDAEVVPIGRPIANAAAYVLGADLEPAAVGETGEIGIGGEAVAVGYWNDAALTATRFVPDPHSARPGGRLYLSGDQGRYRPDGAIEFLGRMDGQVTVRGFRVELREVEAALARDPAIADAVVVEQRGAEPGRGRIVAYVVPLARDGFDLETARKRLRERLPEYMVPPAFVALEALPLTSGGKPDRGELARREVTASATSTGALEPPRTPLEEALVQVWLDVLRTEQPELERIGVRDDFFALGGHSLLILQVLARLRDVLGVELALPRMFEALTVEALAETVAAHAPDPATLNRRAELWVRVAGLSPEAARAELARTQPGAAL
jgi:amino acid adenylation domain-containing protein